MIDLRILRDDPELVRASQRARGADPGAVDRLLAADVERRSAVAAGDSLRAEQKAFGRTIGKASPADRPALLERGKEMAAAVRTAEAAESVANQELAAAQLALPNIIDGAPPGGEQDFMVIKHVGEPAELDFAPKDHLELGESLAAIDMERGAKVSGARFYFLRGVGAQLQWAMLHSRGEQGDRQRVHPDDPAGAGQAGVHGGHRVSRRARRRGLPVGRRRPLPGRHLRGAARRLPLERDPRPGNRSRAVRRVVVVLPAGGRLLRQGHQGHHPGAPVRQGRDVLLLPPAGRRGRAPAAARSSRRRCWPRWRSPTG